MSEWTLFSNHGHVLVCLANNHQARLRDVAAEVGITERAVQNILRELQSSGMVQVSKHGRCNHYQINTRKALRHPLEAHCTVGKLLQLLKSGTPEESSSEIAPQRPSSIGKKQTAVEPGKAAPSAASSSKADRTATAAPAEVVPDKKRVEDPQSEKKPSKDEKKKIPAGDQQGSLF